jgi:hypothetical protein
MLAAHCAFNRLRILLTPVQRRINVTSISGTCVPFETNDPLLPPLSLTVKPLGSGQGFF